MDAAFGHGQPFTVGVEEELFLVERGDGALAPVAAAVLEAFDPDSASAGHEAYATEIELRSRPAPSASGAVAELRDLRSRAAASAAKAGASLLAAGLHPRGELGSAELVDAERYRRVEAEMRGLIQRTPESALHIHVGMPSAEAAVRAFNGLRGWLPLLTGLAAASPFWYGVDSGLASARAAHVRAYPGRGVPRSLTDLDDWRRAVRDAASGGAPDDYTMLWWDVRLHPRLGTVEVREMDAQSRLADVAAIAALIQGLARHEVEGDAAPPPLEAIQWSGFRAMRDGLDAEIVHDGRLAPLREVARAALDLAAPSAREAGAENELGGVERILAEGNGADRQRRAHGAGGMPSLLSSLVRETEAL
jgi:glutamate---cysteine ligase / carboxylate-amine ligase